MPYSLPSKIPASLTVGIMSLRIWFAPSCLETLRKGSMGWTSPVRTHLAV